MNGAGTALVVGAGALAVAGGVVAVAARGDDGGAIRIGINVGTPVNALVPFTAQFEGRSQSSQGSP